MDLKTILYFLPSLCLLALWLIVKKKLKAPMILLAAWVLLLLTLGAYGASRWEEDYECTMLASACLETSSIWFIGPMLIMATKGQWKTVWPIVGCLVLPFVSTSFCFTLLAVTGQVWGM